VAELPRWVETTHKLKFAVKLGDEPAVTSITLREPDIEALEAIEALDVTEGTRMTVKQTKAVICALSGQPPEVIGKLHRDDYIALVEITAPLVLGETKAPPSAG
jgi:hypothetical protein